MMAMAVNNWGDVIEQTLNFGREDNSSKYKQTDPKVMKYENFIHCSHIMIYSLTNSTFEGFDKKANILMQMRCDGYIGFPGGIVDAGETPLTALCRELKEELNWTEATNKVTEQDYMFSHINENIKMVFHFYAIKVSEKKMQEIESNIIKAQDYGNEILGTFRIPLFVMGDGFKGFPSFLKNHFIGNAKLQLIESLIKLQLFSHEEILQALHSAPLIAS